jgi:hypothetical protein
MYIVSRTTEGFGAVLKRRKPKIEIQSMAARHEFRRLRFSAMGKRVFVSSFSALMRRNYNDAA